LFDAVQAMPSIDPLTFDRLFNNGVQDLLMVSYLAKLSRAQVSFKLKELLLLFCHCTIV
jgi:hypothetical protein